MKQKRRILAFVGASIVTAIACGVMIYLQRQKVQEWRTQVQALQAQIAQDRALIAKTPELVKEVIIQRETDEVIKGILSDEEDVNNLVRTLQKFEEDSGISISSMKLQRESGGQQKNEEFGRVAYTLVLEADAFEFLSFLNYVESHSRLMSVTNFKLSSGGRMLTRGTDDDIPRHKITLDLETYVYRPKAGVTEVRIDGYDRKRDTLIGEISKRTSDLSVPRYEYRGRQSRRDPWVDPRVPANSPDMVPIEQQIAIVDELIERATQAQKLWEEVTAADNIIAEMKARAALETELAVIDEEVRRLQTAGILTFIPAERRFHKKVVVVAEELRGLLDNKEGMQAGPSLTALQEAAASMRRHIELREYELAREVFGALESRLAIAEREEFKRPYVQAIYELNRLVETVLDFEAIEISISGIAIYEDLRPVALINGSSVTEGEFIGDDLIVRNIRPDFIEFDYRGVLLARPVESESIDPQAPNNVRGGN